MPQPHLPMAVYVPDSDEDDEHHPDHGPLPITIAMPESDGVEDEGPVAAQMLLPMTIEVDSSSGSDEGNPSGQAGPAKDAGWSDTISLFDDSWL